MRALCVVENIRAKSVEFNCQLWIASVNLRKAFDRISHFALFDAFHKQVLRRSIVRKPAQYPTAIALKFNEEQNLRQCSRMLFNVGQACNPLV